MMRQCEVEKPSPPPGSGEGCPSSFLAVSGGTVRADENFLNDLLTFAARIIPVFLLGLLALRAVMHDDNIGPESEGILLVAPFQDKVLARSTGWHDAPTQLTTEHGSEPRE